MSIYVDLTHESSSGGLRAVLSSGPAVALHRLAIMSKDGDWILEESGAALAEIVADRAERILPFEAPDEEAEGSRSGTSS